MQNFEVCNHIRTHSNRHLVTQCGTHLVFNLTLTLFLTLVLNLALIILVLNLVLTQVLTLAGYVQSTVTGSSPGCRRVEQSSVTASPTSASR